MAFQRYVIVARVYKLLLHCLLFVILYIGQIHSCIFCVFIKKLVLLTDARQRLRSASTSSLVVRRTRLLTVGDGAFPVAAARLWNTLPLNVTSASSISVFGKRLKTHLFSHYFLPNLL